MKKANGSMTLVVVALVVLGFGILAPQPLWANPFGSKDSLLRLVAVAHANGLEVYPDIVLNHVIGGEEDPQAPDDKFKKFRYVGFAGPHRGRWAKDHWNFHPNPDHQCTGGEICRQSFGPDVCYLDAEHGGGSNGRYMHDQAREWFVWLTKQIGAGIMATNGARHRWKRISALV
jgi:glycosidase